MSTFLLASARRSLAFFAACFAIGTAACGTTIVTGGTLPDDPGGGGTGGVVVNGANAIATPFYMGGTIGGSGGTGGCYDCGWGGSAGGYPGSTYSLMLKVGNSGPTCWNTFSPGCSAETQWEVKIGLPDAYLTPGQYALTDPAISTEISAGGSEGGDTCWGEGGSFSQGTVTILSYDGVSITFAIASTEMDSFDANGTYTALVCSAYE